MNATLKELVEKRKELKAVEKKTKAYHFSNDVDMEFQHFKAKLLRKQTEKAIFKILENEK